ncbi:hypothetical protein [Metabacillus idriensis]|nr:hypothetical protein [Metabacillus idriensis]
MKKPIFFKALTDVELLWFITEPAFDNLSDEIKKFTSMVQVILLD